MFTAKAQAAPRGTRRSLLPAQPIGVAALLAASALVLWPQQASACGGCFSPPGPNLVVQDAERILFQRDAKTGRTVVTVEVRYSGPASDFAWVLPLPSKPKVGVSTAYIFDRLDQATSPRFTTTRGTSGEGCDFAAAQPTGGVGGCGGGFAEATSARGGDFASGQAPNFERRPGVKLLEAGQAGPYDYAILEGDTADALLAWLNKNKFATPDKALPVLDAHVKKGDVFVAFRLSSGSDVAQIRPVVLDMQGAEACVPLRLTAIAAADDMAVVVYTLGPGRAVPKNHLHVVPNPLRLRWDGGVENYPQVLASAIDEAAGRAFATEFARQAKSVSIAEPQTLFAADRTALYARAVTRVDGQQVGEDAPNGQGRDKSAWLPGAPFNRAQLDLSGLATAKTKGDVVTWLRKSGFPVVDETAVIFEAHTGLAKANGSSNPKKFWIEVRAIETMPLGSAANDPVDAESLSTDLKVGIVEPIFLVDDAMDTAGTWLTRLHMRISPTEMDRDPMFGFHDKATEVTMDWQATFHEVCLRDRQNIDSARMVLSNTPRDGSWLLDGARMDFNRNINEQVSTALTVATTDDVRWREAPTAADVALLEEIGPPKPIAKSQIALVDSAIAGALPGQTSLPASVVLVAATPFKAPANDASVTLKAASEAATPDDGCGQSSGARRSLATVAPLALAALLLWVARRRQNSLADGGRAR